MSKRKRNLLFLIVPGIAVLYLLYAAAVGPSQLRWLRSPSADLWIARNYRCPRDVHDWMVDYGPRAIPTIITTIRTQGLYTRSYQFLPSALAKIGGSAQQDLHKSIDNTNDPLGRMYLIAALQKGFDDYSRLHVFLDDASAGRLSGFHIMFMGADVGNHFPEAPLLINDDGQERIHKNAEVRHSDDNPVVNPEFLQWWYSKEQMGTQLIIDQAAP